MIKLGIPKNKRKKPKFNRKVRSVFLLIGLDFARIQDIRN